VWLNYQDNNGNYKGLRADKSIRVLFPRTESQISLTGDKKTYRFGFPIDYQLNILNETGLSVNNIYGEIQRPIDVNIKLSVVKGYGMKKKWTRCIPPPPILKKTAHLLTPVLTPRPGFPSLDLPV